MTLPVFEDPIKSGLEPETGGTFNVFNYADYLDKKLMDAFGKKYDVDVQLTTFNSMDEAITRLGTHAVQMDVTEITPDRIAQAVAGKLLKPINHDYIPNLKQNVWPSLHSPYYDTESRYSVPYTLYTTGIAWRSDKVSEDIHKLDNPWSIFWNAQKYKGYVAVLDDSRESMMMAMLYRGRYDINTEDPKTIDAALADMLALIPICNPKVNITGYQTLPAGIELAERDLVGPDAELGLRLSAEGFRSHSAAILGRAQGQGADPERHVGHLLHDEEAGAGPSLAELPARPAERL